MVTDGGYVVKVLGQAVHLQRCIKYLDVTLDKRCSFAAHVLKVAEKASVDEDELSRLMPKGPKVNKRKMYGQVVQSVMLYMIQGFEKKEASSNPGINSKKNCPKSVISMGERALVITD